jgi:hypothetical protein
MNKQTLYIILIVVLFNFLLINIFRLQKDITFIRDKINGYFNKNNYKTLSNINYDNDGIINNKVKEKMNEIAELVPIDFNKIVESKDKFISKDKQV